MWYRLHDFHCGEGHQFGMVGWMVNFFSLLQVATTIFFWLQGKGRAQTETLTMLQQKSLL